MTNFLKANNKHVLKPSSVKMSSYSVKYSEVINCLVHTNEQIIKNYYELEMYEEQQRWY